jgi:hypothetical protein
MDKKTFLNMSDFLKRRSGINVMIIVEIFVIYIRPDMH